MQLVSTAFTSTSQPQSCHWLQPLPPSSPTGSSHTFSPLLGQHLMLCLWLPASAYSLPKMLRLASPCLSHHWLKHYLPGKTFFLATVSPEAGRREPPSRSRLLGDGAHIPPCPLHGPSVAPAFLSLAHPRALTKPVTGPGTSLSAHKKDQRAGLHQRSCPASRHSPRNMSYQTFLALRCCSPFRCFLRLWRLSWKERLQ